MRTVIGAIERPGYVSQVALIELARVFGRYYGVEREQMKNIIDSMTGSKVAGTQLIR